MSKQMSSSGRLHPIQDCPEDILKLIFETTMVNTKLTPMSKQISSSVRLHLIQNCPEDILKLIFETKMGQSTETSQTDYRSALTIRRCALNLASICSAWRRIAINTPNLWNNMVLSMDHPSERILAYWASSMTRVKGVPATIRIYKIGQTSASPLSILEIPASLTIKILHLDFLHPTTGPGTFPKPWLVYPFETLSVSFEEWNRYDQFPVLHYRHLCGQAQSLVVDGPRHNVKIDLEGINVTPLVHLALCKTKGIDLAKLFASHPALETLELDACSVYQPSRVVKGPLLRSLKVENHSGLHWISMVKFPKLINFSHHRQGHPPRNLGTFFQSHRGIRSIEIYYSQHSGEGRVMERFAPFTQNVSTLVLHISGWRVHWADSLANSGVFPALRTLGIIRRKGVVSIEEFDQIVTARCLPISHFMNSSNNASSIIDVFYIDTREDHPFEDVDWCESELYMEATKKVVELADQGRRIYLAWSPEQCKALPVYVNAPLLPTLGKAGIQSVLTQSLSPLQLINIQILIGIQDTKRVTYERVS